MKPTKQTILHDPANGKHGNCFSAVLASLLHVPIDAVPVFSNPSSWQLQLNEWLRPYGLCYMQIGGLKDWIDSVGIAGLHHEQAGNTLRSNDVLHSVVAVDCGPVFDPHPDDTGLTNNVANGVFVSLTPWVAASGASRIAELEAQLEAARKNEARYLWLCDQDDSADIQVLRGIHWTNVAACCALTFQGGKPEIDEAIDAALEATTPENRK